MQRFDVVVLGAGAAGLMCAMEAGRRGRRVLAVDHAERAGKKILISGGGRCNFTNLHTTARNFLSQNRHFAHSALSGFTPAEMVALVERHGIAYHEKTLGQLFCDRSSRDILTMLESECAQAKVRVQLQTRVLRVSRCGDGLQVETGSGMISAGSVVVATGGLSIPQMGATGLGYELAREFGLRIIEPRPGLVPFTFGAADRERWSGLAGVSTAAEVRVATGPARSPRGAAELPAFHEKVLITHRGLSGPAILQVSSYWSAGDTVSLDIAPEQRVFSALAHVHVRRDRVATASQLRGVLPSRWAEHWAAHTMMGEGAAPLSNAEIAALEQGIHAWKIVPAGTEGFAKAEVTVGGVDTAELDAKTMQARKVPGLYFIGEVVDVTGWLGGYNFQWAWASGVAAGRAC